MPSEIAKILIRKGTNADRIGVTLSQAELGYTTDTTRLYIGDGTTPGGIVTSNKIWGQVPSVATLITLNAEVNDIAFYNSKTYSLTALPATTPGNWIVIGGEANGTVTTVEVGDYLNIDGNPSVKSFTTTGSITLEINSLLEVMYPVNTIYTTIVPYVDPTTSTASFLYAGTPGQFNLISGSYIAGIWNFLGSYVIAGYTVYAYQRMS
jgi:hypothetical protein